MDKSRTNKTADVKYCEAKNCSIAELVAEIPFSVLQILGNLVTYGDQTHEPGSWKEMPVEDHIIHALEHICSYGESDEGYAKVDGMKDKSPFDESGFCHLVHATVRLMMALTLIQKRGDKLYVKADTTSK